MWSYSRSFNGEKGCYSDQPANGNNQSPALGYVNDRNLKSNPQHLLELARRALRKERWSLNGKNIHVLSVFYDIFDIFHNMIAKWTTFKKI